MGLVEENRISKHDLRVTLGKPDFEWGNAESPEAGKHRSIASHES
jgi:hypothetical protein